MAQRQSQRGDNLRAFEKGVDARRSNTGEKEHCLRQNVAAEQAQNWRRQQRDEHLLQSPDENGFRTVTDDGSANHAADERVRGAGGNAQQRGDETPDDGA